MELVPRSQSRASSYTSLKGHQLLPAATTCNTYPVRLMALSKRACATVKSSGLSRKLKTLLFLSKETYISVTLSVAPKVAPTADGNGHWMTVTVIQNTNRSCIALLILEADFATDQFQLQQTDDRFTDLDLMTITLDILRRLKIIKCDNDHYTYARFHYNLKTKHVRLKMSSGSTLLELE